MDECNWPGARTASEVRAEEGGFLAATARRLSQPPTQGLPASALDPRSDRSSGSTFGSRAKRTPGLLDIFGEVDEPYHDARQHPAVPVHRAHHLDEQHGTGLVAVVPQFVPECLIEHECLARLPAEILVSNADAATLDPAGNAQAEMEIERRFGEPLVARDMRPRIHHRIKCGHEVENAAQDCGGVEAPRALSDDFVSVSLEEKTAPFIVGRNPTMIGCDSAERHDRVVIGPKRVIFGLNDPPVRLEQLGPGPKVTGKESARWG